MEREGMLVRSIYYGRIGSEATERLLERFGHDGSFLLRDSETVQGAYCLCVRKAPFVHTYRLVRSTNGWCLQDPGVRPQSFGTLETLIENYRRVAASDVGVAPLTEPLDKTHLRYSFGQGRTRTLVILHQNLDHANQAQGDRDTVTSVCVFVFLCVCGISKSSCSAMTCLSFSFNPNTFSMVSSTEFFYMEM
ncbi:SH2 domain-containing protein 1A-like isoform X2 [Anoplopoma fimbria]|uniref:SH2 domain-containing protein 1A-like isoform X2 n=1 Tax=Anoplopoma fimbria TaxID=229290 RepID=UPI0023EBDDB1|nr:SH2 domain-containing protein 1A-like isoform X2 [Anoplopoma fimbria]